MRLESFIRAAEIWLPRDDGSSLAWGGGLYGGMTAFEEASRGMRFAKGEGLPGQAWAARHPIVLKKFENSYFRRIDEAAKAGLTSGIAMPIFSGPNLRAVVVILCGDDAARVGAIEVWRNDPEIEAQIGLFDGYYGNAELFEATSRMTKFGKGIGLPGTVWMTGMPAVIRDLYSSNRFLRRDEALKVGLNVGLGLPFDYDPGRTWVMAFLSALGTPIARRFEIWRPDAGGQRLVYDDGVGGASSGDPERPAFVGPGEGLVGTVLATGLPALTASCGQDAPWLLQPDDSGGAAPAIAMPILSNTGSLKAVTVWRL